MSEGEVKRAMRQLERWPVESARELIALPANERDVVGLLASELEAVPVDDAGYPVKR